MNNKFFSRCKQVFAIFTICICASLLSGCALYDWFVSELQVAFSSGISYEVSVIDCLDIKNPEQIIFVPSVLSKRLSENVREGVVDVSQDPGFKNIRLVDKIPKGSYGEFHKEFFEKSGNYGERTAFLRKYCDNYQTNILIWGATMGDDAEIAFIGFMYRRDLDVLTTSEPQKLLDKMSNREKEALVRKTTYALLKKSLEGEPIGVDGKAASTLMEHKEQIVGVVTFVLLSMLRGE